MANPNTKPGSKQYEDPLTFGQELAAQDPENGLGPISLTIENLINVPGVAAHWEGEIKLRKSEIANRAGQSLQNKLLGALKKNKNSSALQGEDLEDNVQLKDPNDPIARLNLSNKIAKKDGVTAQINRNMLLQATIAIEQSEEITPLMLSTYQRIQATYFTRIINSCESIKKNFPNLDDLNSRDQLILQNATRTQNIIKEYQSYIQTDMSSAISTLKSSILKTKLDPNTKKNENLQSFMNAIKVLKFFPLLQPLSFQLSLVVIEEDKNHPIGYFLNARVHKSAAKFLTIQYTNQYQEEKVRKQINTHLIQMAHSYKTSMDKISGKYDGLNLELLDEYVSAITTFYSDISKMLGSKVQPGILTDAYRTVFAASSSDAQGPTRIEGFVKKIRNVMTKWGIPIPG